MSEEDKSLIDKDEEFDAIVRKETGTLTLPEIAPESMPTLRDVYGRGALAELKSFGGKSLAINMGRVDKAITETRELSQVYNRNHSAWTRTYINLDSYDPWFNMRQVAAEVSSRRAALTETKWKHIENEIEVKRLMIKLRKYEDHFQKLDSAPSVDGLVEIDKPIIIDIEDGVEVILNPDRQLAELDAYKIRTEIAKLQEGMLNGMSHIEGAMKEILILAELYEQLQVELNNFNESDYEKHNARAHLRQALAQSLRDVRGGGSISKGEQRFLEQIGVNPGRLQEELREFIELEKDTDDMSITLLKTFIDSTADKIIKSGVISQKAKLFGLNPEMNEDHIYLDRIGNKRLECYHYSYE